MAINQLRHFLDGNRWYVDGVNGSDSNDGTEQRPWKTLDKFFNEANRTDGGRIDIRCYIVSAGTYDIGANNEHTFNSMTIHISALAPDVILNFLTVDDVKFYESHLNLRGYTSNGTSYPMKITAPNAVAWAIDGGGISLRDVEFAMPITIYAAQGTLINCTYPSLEAHTSTVYLNGCNVTNTDPTVNAYTLMQCNARFLGVHDNADLSADGQGNSYIYAVGSQIAYHITYRDTTHKYQYGLSTSMCTILCGEQQLKNFKSRSIDGIRDLEVEGFDSEQQTGTIISTIKGYKVIDDSLFGYKAGDIYSSAGLLILPAICTANKTHINLNITVSRSLSNVSNINVSRLTGGIRSIYGQVDDISPYLAAIASAVHGEDVRDSIYNSIASTANIRGRYVDGNTDDTDWLSLTGVSVAAFKAAPNIVRIIIEKEAGFENVWNNAPLIAVMSVGLTFA